MPIYEYKCKKCEKSFEKRQSVSESALTVCEECGGELEKQWSLSGFQFKGAGWYVTDYSAKKNSVMEKTSKSESSTPAATTSENSASKTETTSSAASGATSKDT